MMNVKGLKYIFFTASAFLLVAMLIMSKDAGISCDEVLHYNHSVAVYNYFTSQGGDQSALNTPVTHLRYYGQSYDNIVTFIARWLNIEDVYTLRHFMSALAGWLAIFVTALFAVWLSGYRTGLIVIILFAISPTFMGHAQNNLKDIPFALSYIASVFFTLKVLFPGDRKVRFYNILFLILSIGFSISIRAGGLLLICYLFLFFIFALLDKRFKEGEIILSENIIKLVVLILISCAAFFLGILLWPFALQDPIRNVLDSYQIMAHFPDTFRQIFEAKAEWSDHMPWYYLPKSMLITIPVLIFAGILCFFAFTGRIIRSGRALLYSIIIFTILFPALFAIVQKSNLYSSWRQFLFIYPAIVLLSAAGLNYLFESMNNRLAGWIISFGILILAIHPLRFMAENPSYSYIYYNQLVGGLNGAHGNYETDYYFIGQTEASEWLIKYLEERNIDSAVVKATYPVKWQFRKHPGISTAYFRNEERSQHNWDYAIITNRYIAPFRLKNKLWPPEDALHIIYADSVPVCAVIKRKSKADYYGYQALEEGRIEEAIDFFKEAVKNDDQDELIFYNFAQAMNQAGFHAECDSLLERGLALNPDYEPILMYFGNIAKKRGDRNDAITYYEKVIGVNRKYFKAYIELAGILSESDLQKARQILRDCLTVNPKYKPAILALGDTYLRSDPEIAEKYYRLASTIK